MVSRIGGYGALNDGPAATNGKGGLVRGHGEVVHSAPMSSFIAVHAVHGKVCEASLVGYVPYLCFSVFTARCEEHAGKEGDVIGAAFVARKSVLDLAR